MSVDTGGGSTEGGRLAEGPGGADQQVIVSLPETYAAYLFDYCEGILQDPAAAANAVQQTLALADADIPASPGIPTGSGCGSTPSLAGSAWAGRPARSGIPGACEFTAGPAETGPAIHPADRHREY